MFLVNYLATKDEKNDLLKTFKTLDLNGDGKLSTNELIIGILFDLQFDKFINNIIKIFFL